MENITDIIDDLEEIPEQEDQDENERLKENFVDNNEKELDTSNHPLT